MRSCAKYRKLISAWMDNELGSEKQKAVVAHLEGCESCRRMLTEWQLLYECMAQSAPSAPPFFADRLRYRISAQARPMLFRPWMEKLLVPAAAAVGIFLGVLLGRNLDVGMQSNPQQEVVIGELFELEDVPLTSAYWQLSEFSR